MVNKAPKDLKAQVDHKEPQALRVPLDLRDPRAHSGLTVTSHLKSYPGIPVYRDIHEIHVYV